MALAYKSRSRSGGIDWILFSCYFALTIIGLLMVYTTTYEDYHTRGMWSINTPFGGQLLWTGISLVFLLVLTYIDWQFWNSLSLALYVVSIISLIVVLGFGTEIKGAKSWLSIGPWTLQPSEFVKLGTAILVSGLLSSYQIKLSAIKSQLILFAIMIIPALLIILQPDPGSAVTFLSLMIVYFRFGMPVNYYVIGLTFFITVIFSLTLGFEFAIALLFLLTILITSSYSRKNLIYLLLVLTLLFSNILLFQFDQIRIALIINSIFLLLHLFVVSRSTSLYSRLGLFGAVMSFSVIAFASSFAFENILKPHQQDRINVWLQPEKCDPQGSLYNLLQSKLAIGSGGVTGKGYLNGTLTKLNYVPEQTTDFIFSSIGEEQGFLGSVGVVILFLILVLRIINVGELSKYSFVTAFCYAVAGFIFIHFFINIGMTMGISPVIGIPLPFVSKGGSSLLAFSMMIGIVLNMSKQK